MNKLFVILLLFMILLTELPIQAKEGRCTHPRYNYQECPIKHAGCLKTPNARLTSSSKQYNNNIMAGRNYNTGSGRNYMTGAGRNYNTATGFNYRISTAPNYKTPTGFRYR